MIAFTMLTDAHLLDKEAVVDQTSKMIVSQRIGRGLWRQVFEVAYKMKAGPNVQAIVVNDASLEECSLSEPKVFLVTKAL